MLGIVPDYKIHKVGERFEMVQNWLNQNAPGYENLSQEEKNAIMHFSLLWSLFEGQVLNESACANKIEAKINTWHKSGLLNAEEFEHSRNCFIQRYIENGETNHRFQNLNFRGGDKSNLVESVLKSEINSIASVVTALLIIVYRYRNNFFHGIKWASQFRGQSMNFNTANELLMKVIEINNKPDS